MRIRHQRGCSFKSISIFIIISHGWLLSCGCYLKDKSVSVPKVLEIRNCGGIPQTEIQTSSGIRIYIDIADPESLSVKPSSGDYLLISRGHFDHWDGAFIDNFPGKKIIVEEKTLQDNSIGLSIRSVIASRLDNNTDCPEKSPVYLFMIAVDGLKIAFFGDIGQKKLTLTQERIFSDTDIAIMPFSYPHGSTLTVDGQNAFNYQKILKAKILIPTHCDEERVFDAIHASYEMAYVSSDMMLIEKGSLPKETTFILMDYLSRTFCGRFVIRKI